jgi:Cu+-exporting ATPase
VLAAGEISRHSCRRTRHNVALAFAFNAVGAPAAATGLALPIWAMAAMVASVTVVYLKSRHGSLAGVLSAMAGIGRRPAAGEPAPAAAAMSA